MEILPVSNIKKIKENKKEIEDKLKIKLNAKKDFVEIDGKQIDEYVAIQVFEAIDLGFSIPTALLLSNEDYMFEKLNIKDFSHKDPKRVRGRVIGTHRKTLDTIEKISHCQITLHDNILGIIGQTEDMPAALQALESLIRGSKQSNVYKYLEEQQKKPDIPLKIRKE